MKRSVWVAIGVGVVVVGVLLFPRREKPAPATQALCALPWSIYQIELEKARHYKDSVFRHSERSPIPAEERVRFSGLRYFRSDSSWRMEGTYEPLPNALAPVVGTLTVALPALDSCRRPVKLLVYGDKGGETYVAFWDSTAAQGLVYEGGRYVPIQINGGRACIDFNRAYFPYCAYNPNYICLPYPPQNRLCVAIRAGERY